MESIDRKMQGRKGDHKQLFERGLFIEKKRLKGLLMRVTVREAPKGGMGPLSKESHSANS